MTNLQKCPICGGHFKSAEGVTGILDGKLVFVCTRLCSEISGRLNAEESAMGLSLEVFENARRNLNHLVIDWPKIGGVVWRVRPFKKAA